MNANFNTPSTARHDLLYVEDDAALRNQFADLLFNSGYRVEVAEDGQAGWEALQLPLAWQPQQWWPVPLHHRARETGCCRLPESNPLPQIGVDPSLVTLAKLHIEEHNREDPSLEQVADALGTDAFLLGRLFRRTTGMNFSDYIASVRVESAKYLLLNPHYGFDEIASELGFASLTEFRRSFESIVGESPRAYRGRMANRLWGTSPWRPRCRRLDQ